MYHINDMIMIRIYILSLTTNTNVSQNSIMFSMLYKPIFKRKLKLIKDKTNIMVFGIPHQIINIDLPSKLKLDQDCINLSRSHRNLKIMGLFLIKI